VQQYLPKRRGLTLATCCGVHSLQDGLTDLLYVLLPILAQTFGLSYAQIGMIRAANRCAMALFEIPAGMLAERTGERALLSFGLLSVGIGYLTLSIANGFLAILLSLFIAGLGAAFQHTLSSSIISRSFEGSGQRGALGTYNSAGDVGKLAFAGLFTLLVGIGIGWQNIVTGFGTVALLASVIVLMVLHRLQVGGPPKTHQEAENSSAILGWGFRNGTAFTALSVIIFLDIAVQGGFLTFLAFLMIAKNVPASFAAFAVVLTLTGGVFGKFSCGFLAAKLGVIRSLVLVECLTALGIIAVLLLPTMMAYFLLPVLGAALQGSSSITYGTVGDLVHPDRQSRGFAIAYSVANAAAILAPIGFGIVGDHFGLSATMLTMACVILLPLPLCLILRNGLEREYA